MTYYGVILSLSGYQADEGKIRSQYKTIIDRYVFLHPKILSNLNAFIGSSYDILQARCGF